MKKKQVIKKRVVSVFLSAILAAGLLSGCGKEKNETGNGAQSGEPSAETKDKALEDYTDPISYSFWLQGCSMPVDMAKTEVAKYIKEKFNIDISVNFYAGGDNYSQKLNMAIAADELPDVIMGWGSDKETIAKLADAGKLLPLDQYIDEYFDYYMENYCQEIVLDAWRNEDGKLYSIPSFTLPDNETIQTKKMVEVTCSNSIGIREDIFEQLNLPIPKSPDELMEVLIKIRDAQLETDGQTVYPLGLVLTNPSNGNLNLNFFETMFGTNNISQNKFFDTEKKVRIQSCDLDGYADMLKYVAKIYREGLVAPDIFNFKEEDDQKISFGAREAVRFGNPWGMDTINVEIRKIDENARFIPIDPIRAEGVELASYNIQDPYGILSTSILADVKDPDRLMKLLAWTTTDEGYRYVYYGLPGEHNGYNFWDYDADGNVINGGCASTEKEGEAWSGDNWYVNVMGGYTFLPLNIRSEKTYLLPGFAPNGDAFSTLACVPGYLKEDYAANAFTDNIGTALDKIESGPIAKDKGTSVSKILTEGFAKIIMKAQSDEEVDRMFQQVMADADKAGRQEILKEMYELQYGTYQKLTAAE